MTEPLKNASLKPPENERARIRRETRDKIIGMGDQSMRKNYYRELRGRIADLERFRVLLEESSEVILLLEIPSGRVVDLTARACFLFHLSKNESIGFSFFDCLEADLRKPIVEFLTRPETEPFCERGALTLAGRLAYPAPADRQFEISVHRSRVRNVCYAVAVAHDMTERVRTERILRAAKESAEHAARARSEFISIASHELRTPLTALRGLAQLAKIFTESRRPLTPQILDGLLTQADRLNNMIGDLLTVSRLERGAFTIHPEQVDLRALATEMVERYQRQTPERRLNLEIAEGADWVTRADPGRIEQVLANLIENAIKYSPEHGPIEVRLSKKDRALHVEVHDVGAPPPALQEQWLFDMFSRMKSDENIRKPGLGLGLYICRQIIHLHGGRIGLARGPDGSGNTFFFDLPATTEPKT